MGEEALPDKAWVVRREALSNGGGRTRGLLTNYVTEEVGG